MTKAVFLKLQSEITAEYKTYKLLQVSISYKAKHKLSLKYYTRLVILMSLQQATVKTSLHWQICHFCYPLIVEHVKSAVY